MPFAVTAGLRKSHRHPKVLWHPMHHSADLKVFSAVRWLELNCRKEVLMRQVEGHSDKDVR